MSFVTDDPIKNNEIIDKFKNKDIEDIIIILSYTEDIPKIATPKQMNSNPIKQNVSS